MKFNLNNLQRILNYFCEEEVTFLEEEIGEDLPENLGEAIKFCERQGLTNYIAYNLLVLKEELQRI
jgi:hypothetical protein